MCMDSYGLKEHLIWRTLTGQMRMNAKVLKDIFILLFIHGTLEKILTSEIYRYVYKYVFYAIIWFDLIYLFNLFWIVAFHEFSTTPMSQKHETTCRGQSRSWLWGDPKLCRKTQFVRRVHVCGKKGGVWFVGNHFITLRYFNQN